MALPRGPTSPWRSGIDLPTNFFQWADDDYELFEEDGEFVLSIELPGFDPEEIDVAWNDGLLNVAAEHEDEERGRSRTYHRRFRMPKAIDPDAIGASYTNGVLEVRLPVEETGLAGKRIEIEG